MKRVPLGEIAEIVSGATPKTGTEEYWGGSIQWATPADLSELDTAYISCTPRTLTEEGVRSCATKILPAGSVLLSSRAPIGHVAINTIPIATNQGFKSLVPAPEIDAKYLYHWLKANAGYLQSLGNGATFKELSKRTTQQIEIPLPPVDEQRRIAVILDHANCLRAKRRQLLNRLDRLEEAIFFEMFAGESAAPSVLGDVAEIRGGLQVSSKRAQFPVEVPYLRVANVYRGYLELSEVKTLRASEREIDRTILRTGDLLIVEGHANPREIGRVAVWGEEVENCAHQNHLIRARLDFARVLPVFVAAWLNSTEGAEYFRRVSKTTSGLNAINISSVRNAPLALPSIRAQKEFEVRIAKLNEQRSAVQRAVAADDELFASLQYRAFRGEL